MDLMVIIAADLSSQDIKLSNLKTIKNGWFRRKKNELHVSSEFEIVIQPLLFVGHRINDRVIEREGRLLGDGFKNDEISLRKRCSRLTVSHCQNTEVLLAISKSCCHHRYTAKSAS